MHSATPRHTHTHTHTHTHRQARLQTHTHTHAHTCTHVHTCTQAHMHAHTHAHKAHTCTHTHTCTHVEMHARTHGRKYTCVHTDTLTWVHTHAHMHTHRHTRLHSNKDKGCMDWTYVFLSFSPPAPPSSCLSPCSDTRAKNADKGLPAPGPLPPSASPALTSSIHVGGLLSVVCHLSCSLLPGPGTPIVLWSKRSSSHNAAAVPAPRR